eukprot:scaffold118822_cov49-Attheya_sp.AAC.4
MSAALMSKQNNQQQHGSIDKIKMKSSRLQQAWLEAYFSSSNMRVPMVDALIFDLVRRHQEDTNCTGSLTRTTSRRPYVASSCFLSNFRGSQLLRYVVGLQYDRDV